MVGLHSGLHSWLHKLLHGWLHSYESRVINPMEFFFCQWMKEGSMSLHSRQEEVQGWCGRCGQHQKRC
jgi:hypothetical protein